MYIAGLLKRWPDIDTFYIEIYEGKDFNIKRYRFANNPLTTRIISKNKLDILNHFTIIAAYILSDYGEPDEICIKVV